MHVNADSLLIRAATTSTSGTLNDLATDLIMENITTTTTRQISIRSNCFYMAIKQTCNRVACCY